MLDIHNIMKGLAERRPIFHSEADFQLGLASHVCNTSAGAVVRVNHKVTANIDEIVDIWFPSDGTVIELTHRLEPINVTHDGVKYDLKHHGARDQGRYDFIKSIAVVENAVSRISNAKHGFSVMLTNDPEYWIEPRAGWQDTYDSDFRIHEGSILSGMLAWDPDASEGTTQGRIDPIRLRGTYKMHWCDYSRLDGGEYSDFRYLAIEVGK